MLTAMKRLATVVGWCVWWAAPAALAQTATPSTPVRPVTESRIPYPPWLFPVSEEVLLPALALLQTTVIAP